MWTMPVARMTPAANALTAKKMSPSGCSAAMERPSTGTSTPAAPAVRMDAMAISFSFIAPRLSVSVPFVVFVHLEVVATANCAKSRSHGNTFKVSHCFPGSCSSPFAKNLKPLSRPRNAS